MAEAVADVLLIQPGRVTVSGATQQRRFDQHFDHQFERRALSNLALVFKILATSEADATKLAALVTSKSVQLSSALLALDQLAGTSIQGISAKTIDPRSTTAAFPVGAAAGGGAAGALLLGIGVFLLVRMKNQQDAAGRDAPLPQVTGTIIQHKPAEELSSQLMMQACPLVFKAHRRLYHSALGLSEIKKEEKACPLTPQRRLHIPCTQKAERYTLSDHATRLIMQQRRHHVNLHAER